MRMSSGVAIATSVSARSEPKALYAQDRTDRMNLTAPMPLLATRMLQGGAAWALGTLRVRSGYAVLMGGCMAVAA
jgi:hypothetical protein